MKTLNWKHYDPEWIIKLSKKQYPRMKWLHESLGLCTKYFKNEFSYIYFKDPSYRKIWVFNKNIILQDDKKGTLVLDILKNNIIGGLEFVDLITEY